MMSPEELAAHMQRVRAELDARQEAITEGALGELVEILRTGEVDATYTVEALRTGEGAPAPDPVPAAPEAVPITLNIDWSAFHWTAPAPLPDAGATRTVTVAGVPPNVWQPLAPDHLREHARVWRHPDGTHLYAPFLRSLPDLRARRERGGWVTLTREQAVDWLSPAVGTVLVEDPPSDHLLVELHPSGPPTEVGRALDAFTEAVTRMRTSMQQAVERYSFGEDPDTPARVEARRAATAWAEAAQATFLTLLTPEQRETWSRARYIDLYGSHRQDLYRLTSATSGNVYRHRDFVRFCTVHHDPYAPQMVTLLCQYRLLQLDEPQFLSKCNVLGTVSYLPGSARLGDPYTYMVATASTGGER